MCAIYIQNTVADKKLLAIAAYRLSHNRVSRGCIITKLIIYIYNRTYATYTTVHSTVVEKDRELLNLPYPTGLSNTTGYYHTGLSNVPNMLSQQYAIVLVAIPQCIFSLQINLL